MTNMINFFLIGFASILAAGFIVSVVVSIILLYSGKKGGSELNRIRPSTTIRPATKDPRTPQDLRVILARIDRANRS